MEDQNIGLLYNYKPISNDYINPFMIVDLPEPFPPV